MSSKVKTGLQLIVKIQPELPARHLYRMRPEWGVLYHNIYSFVSDNVDLNGAKKQENNQQKIWSNDPEGVYWWIELLCQKQNLGLDLLILKVK